MPPKAPKSNKILKELIRSVRQGAPRRGPGGGGGDFEPDAVLRCTQKACNSALLIQQRCMECHGELVRDVVGKVLESGSQYKMADLKYDVKNGRLEVLEPGADAGPTPTGKPREAPKAGQPLPPASLDEFFTFMQCQHRMEVREHIGGKLLDLPAKADEMWSDVEAFVTPNLGATERWVPYHTVLGVHELFLVQQVHSRKDWTERQRFLAMFIFRAHCKRDLFMTAQLPLMEKQAFWKDPKASFAAGGPMEKAIYKYRKDTGKPLITSCFRIIPPRVLKDDDLNLVRSITNRTEALLEVAEQAWDVLKNKSRSAVSKITEISNMIQDANGCGETWAKMLTVCVDIAYPKEQFLEQQCDVGTGAAAPLRCLLPDGGDGDRTKDLKSLLKLVNGCKSPQAKHFWNTLQSAESRIRSKFKAYPLVCAQSDTKAHAMTAVTLQVQLCEYRQYRHSVARLQYGLPDDEAMRGEPEGKVSIEPENFLEWNEKRKVIEFDFPVRDGKVHFEVPVKSVGNQKMVAVRVASMCFAKLREGMSKQDAEKFRDEVCAGYRGGDDVPEDSAAWLECKVQMTHKNPVCAFTFQTKDGQKHPFQTTQSAAGGSVLEMERIARLCWVKLRKGAAKDAVLEYRDGLYKKRAAGVADMDDRPTPAKKARK